MPDDLYVIVILAGGISCSRLYGAGTEVAHLRVESSWAHLLDDWY